MVSRPSINTSEATINLSKAHDFKTPSTYTSPQNFREINSDYLNDPNHALMNIFYHAAAEGGYIYLCSAENCEETGTKSDTKNLYCDSHAPPDAAPIFLAHRCRKCDAVAAAIDFDFCEETLIRESIYEENKTILRNLEKSLQTSDRNIFLCSKCCPNPAWNFSNVDTWLARIRQIIEDVSNIIKYTPDQRNKYLEARGAMRIFTLRENYAKQLVEDAEHPEAELFSGTISRDIQEFIENYPEMDNSGNKLAAVSRILKGEDTEKRARIDLAQLEEVRRIQRMYHEQNTKLADLANECNDYVIFADEFVHKLFPGFFAGLENDELSKLLLVSWFCMNYGYFGTKILNIFTFTIPSQICAV